MHENIFPKSILYLNPVIQVSTAGFRSPKWRKQEFQCTCKHLARATYILKSIYCPCKSNEMSLLLIRVVVKHSNFFPSEDSKVWCKKVDYEKLSSLQLNLTSFNNQCVSSTLTSSEVTPGHTHQETQEKLHMKTLHSDMCTLLEMKAKRILKKVGRGEWLGQRAAKAMWTEGLLCASYLKCFASYNPTTTPEWEHRVGLTGQRKTGNSACYAGSLDVTTEKQKDQGVYFLRVVHPSTLHTCLNHNVRVGQTCEKCLTPAIGLPTQIHMKPSTWRPVCSANKEKHEPNMGWTEQCHPSDLR